MDILMSVANAGNLIIPAVSMGLDLALKLKSLLELNPDISVNITNLAGEAVAADDATTQTIADWKTQHNLS